MRILSNLSGSVVATRGDSNQSFKPIHLAAVATAIAKRVGVRAATRLHVRSRRKTNLEQISRVLHTHVLDWLLTFWCPSDGNGACWGSM